MKHTYTPRRASKTRWLQDAPDYILDVMDHDDTPDRYTILLTGSMLAWSPADAPRTFANTWIQFVGSTASGASYWGELEAYKCAQYRYRNSRHRIKWNDLPEAVKKEVIFRVTQT